MQLEQLVCSLELARQLKEAGVPQESQFYWTNSYLERHRYVIGDRHENSVESDPGIAAAFTPEELLRLFPKEIDGHFLTIMVKPGFSRLLYTRAHLSLFGIRDYEDPSLANVAAKLLLSLIEKGLYTPSQG